MSLVGKIDALSNYHVKKNRSPDSIVMVVSKYLHRN